MTAEEAMDRRRLWAVLGSLMLVMLLASLDQTIVSTALPTIVGDLGGLEHLSWVVTAYLLASDDRHAAVRQARRPLRPQAACCRRALVLFLIGSALCGLAQTMTELIAFRAIQGLGGGGLMVSAQAAIGDVVPPRERGRYTGLFGAVFGVRERRRPADRRLHHDHLSWRWIFYINLPLGVVALAVLAVDAAERPVRAPQHAIDYAGSALLAVGPHRDRAGHDASAARPTTGPRRRSSAWPSSAGRGPRSPSCSSERRAAEPILPLRLFRNASFRITSAVGFVIGFALFGALTYLPLFQQVVRGASPTASGLQLLPLMAGVLIVVDRVAGS